ncbi:hypothetical protein B5F77_11475 [Parabacteroides sp. An277]|uniref:hypothetical protein n=1 Tax=Parabacteroides sp. An277 TaxID=1965619 RepID=UPI000B38CC8F|nr:hypothetical protein [Parabacteroides sp. An277]OUO51063.1 hypothetical protein B5F77_11475 [Parabacteroides sp. An277]
MDTTMRPAERNKKASTRIYGKNESVLSKEEVLTEFSEALEELKLVRKGKRECRLSAREFLEELRKEDAI